MAERRSGSRSRRARRLIAPAIPPIHRWRNHRSLLDVNVLLMSGQFERLRTVLRDYLARYTPPARHGGRRRTGGGPSHTTPRIHRAEIGASRKSGLHHAPPRRRLGAPLTEFVQRPLQAATMQQSHEGGRTTSAVSLPDGATHVNTLIRRSATAQLIRERRDQPRARSPISRATPSAEHRRRAASVRAHPHAPGLTSRLRPGSRAIVPTSDVIIR